MLWLWGARRSLPSRHDSLLLLAVEEFTASRWDHLLKKHSISCVLVAPFSKKVPDCVRSFSRWVFGDRGIFARTHRSGVAHPLPSPPDSRGEVRCPAPS